MFVAPSVSVWLSVHCEKLRDRDGSYPAGNGLELSNPRQPVECGRRGQRRVTGSGSPLRLGHNASCSEFGEAFSTHNTFP